MKKLQASLTGEMALLFPVILLLLVLTMTAGISSAVALNSSVAMGEGLMILENAARKNEDESVAAASARSFIIQKTSREGASSTVDVSCSNTFFSKTAEIKVEGWLYAFPSGSWSFHQKKNVVDPVRFKNRVDLILEAVSQ